ncbi:hypothetical protein IFM89_017433 [Coptis chinensis]|uniref:Uncharacterized protein n=1 Tax=Coptis chinensis TaxID=261450 RepID=A0A835H4M5_9MAGN|nr:hypothetical protein IFM89_017433 [Coptis chinensis]
MPTRTITESATFSDVETPTRNADGALLLQKKVVNQNLADLFTSQSNGLSNQPTLKFCQEEMRSDFDCDRFGDQTNVTDSSFSFLSTIRGETSDSSIPEALYLQENHAVLSLAHSMKSLGAIDIYQQNGSVGEPTPHILDSGCQSKQIVYEEPELHISSREVTEFVQKMATSEETKIIMAQTLSNFEIVKPLSMYLGGSYPLAMIDNKASSKGKATENGEREIAKQAFLIDQNSDNEVLENDNLPFIKTTSCRLDDKLCQIREKTSKLQIDEPKCVLENILEVLPHFEACFNVGPIRALLKELLRVKDTKLQLDEKLKQIGGDIIKAKDDEEAQKSEMDKLDQKLRELQEAINEKNKERQTIVEIKQTTSSIIAFLQKRLVEIEKEMQNTKLNFHSVVAAPW